MAIASSSGDWRFVVFVVAVGAVACARDDWKYTPRGDASPADVASDTSADVASDTSADIASDTSADVAPADVAPADVAPADVAPADVACAAGQTRCGESCVDTQSDVAHCGACGMRCSGTGGVPACVVGGCVSRCFAGFHACGSACAVDTSVTQCGVTCTACAAPADGTTSCAGGACVPACNTGFHLCGATCASNTSVAQCGASCMACTAPASGTVSCAGGACVPACNAGFHLCGTTCVTDASVAQCGASCVACTAPANGTAACVAGACDFTCNAGLLRLGGRCGTAPRPIAPLSTATVTSRRPTLQWALTLGDGAHVDLCRNRGLTTGCVSFDATGSSGAPAADLARGVWFWRLTTRLGTVTSTAVGPVWQFFVGGGTSTVDTSSGTTLDVNGDGYADVAVTALRSTTAYVYLGGPAGLAATPTTTLTGPSGFGIRVASAGDVDGDGYSDLIVGANLSNRAYFYLGGAAGLNTTPTTLSGPAGTGFGWSVSSAGDINRDGYSDVIVGTTDSNTVYIYLGSATGLNPTPTTLVSPIGGIFGLALAGAGDVNGDGFGDVLVCVQQNNAYLYYGSAAGLNPTPTTLPTPSGSSYFGRYATGAGDLNGDGYSDVAVGASVSSTAYVYYGSATGLNPSATTLTGTAGSYFSEPLGAGDVNADGYSDLIVGENGGLSNPGLVYVYPGSATGLSTTRVILSTPPGTLNFGSGVAGTGDVNGDGYGDVMVGSTGDNSAYLYLGSATGVRSSPTMTFPPPSGANGFGQSIASADKVHGRGRVLPGASTAPAACACFASKARSVTPAARRATAA